MHYISNIEYNEWIKMHITKCIEYDTYNTTHEIQCIEYNAYNTMHIKNAKNTMYRLQYREYN